MVEEKIDILLASYNGAQYIRNQILSLQQQTHNNWHLYIRDDGSTDDTLKIIQEFMSIDSRITLIKDDKSGLGAALNFKELFNYTTADYAIFCDQDDIWFEKKLELLLQDAKEKFSVNLPCMVYCDGYGYDTDTGSISIQSIAATYTTTLKSFLFFNGGRQGCSTLFNKKAAKMLKDYNGSDVYMHDSLMSMTCYSFGQVFFLPKKLMLYRQHSGNVTGNMPTTSYDKLKLNLVDCPIGVLDERVYRERKEFLSIYQAQLTEDNKHTLSEYVRFASLGKLERLKLVIKNKFSLDNSMAKLCVKILLRR